MSDKALIALLEVSDRLPQSQISSVTFVICSLMFCSRFYDREGYAKQTLTKVAANIRDTESLQEFLYQIRNFASVANLDLTSNMTESLEAMAKELKGDLKTEMVDVMLTWNVRSEEWIPPTFKKTNKASNKGVIEFLLKALAPIVEHIPENKIVEVMHLVESIAKEYGCRKYYVWHYAMDEMAQQVREVDLETLPQKITTGLDSEDITEQIIAASLLKHNIYRVKKTELDILITKVRTLAESSESDIKGPVQKILEAYYKAYPEEIFNLVGTFPNDKEGSQHCMAELVKYAHFMDDGQVSRMFGIFQNFADSDNPDIRFWVAYELRCFREKEYPEQVFAILKQLSADQDMSVRRQVADSMDHVCVRLMMTNLSPYLKCYSN
jgi:hypothetical protein